VARLPPKSEWLKQYELKQQQAFKARSAKEGRDWGPKGDWAFQTEKSVRQALAAADRDIARVLKRDPGAVRSSYSPEGKAQDWTSPSWQAVLVGTESGIGDPYQDKRVHEAFGQAVEKLNADPFYKGAFVWGWESINPAVHEFRMTPVELKGNPRRNPIQMLGEAQSNPAHRNPWEVHSESGLEGVFADEDDARFYAEEIRGSGAQGVAVERRMRKLVPRQAMLSTNPSDPAWQVSRSVTNVAQGIGFLGGDVNKATSYFRHVGVEVQGVGYGWLERCYAEPSWETGKMAYTCLVELTDGQVDAFAADEVWPVAGRYPESPRRRSSKSNPAGRNWPIGRYPLAQAVDRASQDTRTYTPEALYARRKPQGLLHAIEAHAIDEQRVEAGIPSALMGNPPRVLREKYGDSSEIVIESNRFGYTGWLESKRGGGRLPISFGATKPETAREAMELAKKFLRGVHGRTNPGRKR
jgi:hypothetical protein